MSDAWIRLVLPSRPAAGYFTLSNETDEPLALVGAASPACGSLMLHKSVQQNGQERMEMVDERHRPRTRPGHLRARRLSPDVHVPSKDVTPGGSVPVTLRFEDGGKSPRASRCAARPLE